MTSDVAVRLSVLMATYNRRSLLPVALAPLLDDPCADEIVVVVDGSRDGSFEYLQETAQEHPKLKPLFVPNGGALRALQVAARSALGEIVVIVDDDEVIEPQSLAGHLHHHGSDRNLVLVGYVEMNRPARRRPGDFSRYKYMRAYEADCARWEACPDSILRNLWGGYISMRRRDYLRAMDGLDDFVDGYHFDLDFGARCLELGFHARFDRSLRALHLYERDRRSFVRDARSSRRNRIRIHHAHAKALGRLDPAFVDAGLPRWAAALVNLALEHAVVLWLFNGAITLLGLLHLWQLETRASILLWAIEQKRGALEAADELRTANTAG